MKHITINFTAKELNDIAEGINSLEAMIGGGEDDSDFMAAVKSFDKALKRAGKERSKNFAPPPNFIPNIVQEHNTPIN